MVKASTAILLAVVASFFAGCATQTPGPGDLPPPAAVPTTSDPGFVQFRYFDNISGSDISNLTETPAFPDNPDRVESLTSLEMSNRGNNYGAWVRGFIMAPATGDYRFFISADDAAQLLLSPSDQPGQAGIIATVPGKTSQGDYSKYSSQASGIQRLTEGQPYYFEVLFKQGGGPDHFSVAWEGPGMAQQVIGTDYLYSWSESGFGDGETTQEAYSLGYRVGYLDGSENLAFNQLYPPLDEDGDGLYDNWEIANGLNPGDPNDSNNDPDGDLISAADEFLIGTRENNPDSDADGMPDGFEYASGLDPLDSADASTDLDNDGFTNLEEYEAGTSINDSQSFPVVDDGGTTTEPVPTTGTAIISWTAPSTRSDGTSLALSEINSYLVKYGTSETALDQSVVIPGYETSATIEGLSTGTWYFTVQTEDTGGLLSPPSPAVSKTIN
ncbi:fibronectin type III domain-containing protein [Marinobacter sp. chi1]|uniref:Fibronectin type III domain-containing protein n=1 Tax=Marinobacter suaedae TaxID=3057675 RepID=A0ABT8VZQ9_9GAMM|nr:fibronectin type III domain-containing protein [Marinobacter sp. chi1]MDO3721479.1 fibronectin type III domain-containing protein [Marinobacter sp. chi1]